MTVAAAEHGPFVGAWAYGAREDDVEPKVELVTIREDGVQIYKLTPTTLTLDEQQDALRRHLGAPDSSDSFMYTITGEHP